MRPSLSPLATRRSSESPFFRSLFWARYGERRQRAAPFRSSRTSAWTLVAAAVSFMLQRAWIWRTGQSFAQARLYPRVCARPRSDFAWTLPTVPRVSRCLEYVVGFSFGVRPTRTRSLQDGWFGACGPDGWLHESCMGWMQVSSRRLQGGKVERVLAHTRLAT